MTWTDFPDGLRTTLRAMTDRCVLVVSASDDGGLVQFSVLDDALYAEAAGPGGSGSSDQAMRTAGWLPPTRGRANWSCDVPLPALTSEFAALADRCAIALRDVFGIADPSALSYRAWREPELQPAGVTWSPERFDQLDSGENPVLLPGLGLQPA